MKLTFGFLLFVAAVAITGGLYLVIRKPAQKKTDLRSWRAYAARSFVVFGSSTTILPGFTPPPSSG